MSARWCDVYAFLDLGRGECTEGKGGMEGFHTRLLFIEKRSFCGIVVC